MGQAPADQVAAHLQTTVPLLSHLWEPASYTLNERLKGRQSTLAAWPCGCSMYFILFLNAISSLPSEMGCVATADVRGGFKRIVWGLGAQTLKYFVCDLKQDTSLLLVLYLLTTLTGQKPVEDI